MTRRGGLAANTLPLFEVVDRAQPQLPRLNSEGVTGVSAPAASANVSTLPAVIDVETAGRLLGLGRSAAYQLVKDGEWPTPVLRLGRRWRVLTAPLLALLEIDGVEPSAAGARLPMSPTAPAIFRHDQGDQR